MPDITMCQSEICPRRQECYRFTAMPTPGWQSYFDDVKLSWPTCDSFWPTSKK